MARNSLHGKLVAVVGGSGFIGRHLAQELLKRGARLRLISRNVERASAVKPLGNLGQVQLLRGDVRKADELASLLAGADGVVNLAGTFAGNLDAVMGSGAGAVARAAQAAGAKAMVHVSAIGADAGGETAYARAKAAGEAAVLAAFPAATVLRPSVLFGPDDMFINRFAGLIARFPVMPVFAPQAELQPVFVDDVALAIANALADPAAHGGKTFEIAGPQRLTMAQLNRMIAAGAHRSPLFLDLPDSASGLFVALTGWLPGAPISGQQWKLLKAGNAASDNLPGLKELGVSARPLGLFLDRWLVRFRKHGRFGN
ncbi:SDR family NAD(P)-dependent oxidoreductase [Novosphingobium sp.]|mgnify:FL=1|uniref:SDR family NAD(P)-dependent oxidoreductase n=1 Tax=Novosphingobium sp. TaxID=1874826 RepID=UPI001EBDB9AF|nr:SDR family NAD(P)-dependent oxidoreductase [Novosphingobium sp.]MBK6801931.1 SDR family NAD(P)-dependent oxidoreductase [Novosphingobium sp.]MBK9010227.1 SDR family NAD(P)-dependent oxidoreductase [Novosphingobium sp.]